MSIVGTRPPLISETNLYEPRHKARKLLVISPVHPVLETIIAAAAIAVVRDREPQGLVVQPVLWDLLVQEGVPV